MLEQNRLTLAISTALGLGAASALPARAQDEPLLEEVVVTGSMIKRIDLDNALPVQVLTAEAIKNTGVATTKELIQTIPAMQNPIGVSASVGGDGGGINTANLRGIGKQYTLSLLNNRRMAPADDGSTIDLSNIPLSAVERVEILTDGASALYGSDAIAGVVNFILKDEVEETTISVRGDQPEESGGESWNFDIVTGFGSLAQDGYSLVAGYSHQEQDALKASDRDFAETGLITFREGGDRLYFELSSPNAIPGNAFVSTADLEEIKSFNPNAATNGVCAPQTTPVDELCFFDYTRTIEVMPEDQRDSLFLNGKLNLGSSITLFATGLASNYQMTSRTAPYPTGDVPLALDSDLVQNEVFPHLTPEQQAQAGDVTGNWRALPAGNRVYEWETDSYNLTVGLEGSAGAIDYTTALTYAITDTTQDYPNGWLLRDEFLDIISAGGVNIFASQDEFTEADAAALAPAIYHGPWDEVENTMTAFDASASMPVFDLGDREVYLAAGVDYRNTNYKRTISEANAEEALLFLSPDTPYELERDQWGVFGELLVPLTDTLEVTGSLRYDDVSGVADKLNGGDIDDGDDDTTYKISGLWNVTGAIALRGSYGTGFKAPSMREIGEPLSESGFTSNNWSCPFPADDPMAQYCLPGERQYNIFRQGSPDLQFETSTQYTYGLVLTPWERFDMTVDYWNIELEDLVDRLTESQIFNDPVSYRNLFTTETNLATGREELAIIQAAVNVGSKENEGVDYAINQGFDLGWGALDLGLRGTYIIKSESSLTGSSLGRYGNDEAVVFRNIVNLVATLHHGDFQHAVNVRYRSGYDDQIQEVEILDTGAPLGQGPRRDVQLKVDAYTTIDYQLTWNLRDDSLGLTFGVNNLNDREPPLSLRTGDPGHQVGWDPRYVDPYGRTYYLQAEYRFF
jgi:iron complex outermembrane receptor protein